MLPPAGLPAAFMYYYIAMDNKNGSRRKINLAEFQELLGQLKDMTIADRENHSNVFTGTVNGLPVTINFNFQTLAGHIETHSPSEEQWKSSDTSS